MAGLLTPLAEGDATDKAAQTYGRIKDMLGTVPEAYLYMGRVPAFLQDFYMNSKKMIFTGGKLDEVSKLEIALAVSAQGRCQPMIDLVKMGLDKHEVAEQELADVLAVAASCAMYNVFFKFRDLSGSSVFEGMPVGLRAHTFTNTTLDDKKVELINVAISDVNGCKPCTSGHLAKAKQLGANDEELLEVIQCAATTYAGVQFLNSSV